MRRAGIIAGVVFALDQATKVWVVHGLDLKTRLAIDVLESGRRLVVSTQVLLETWWVLTRRLE